MVGWKRFGVAVAFSMGLVAVFPAHAVTRDVDNDRPDDLGDGLSWATASKYLQTGLDRASAGDAIWIAEAAYDPDEGADQRDNDRYSAFRLKDGIALHGGFAGYELSLAERDLYPATRVTVLSGDIDRNDRDDDSNGIAETTAAIEGEKASASE